MRNKAIKKVIVFVLIMVACIVFIRFNRSTNVKTEENPKSIVNDITDPENIPEGYIAVFHSGFSPEVGSTTYFYKLDNGHDNYGFEYIKVSWNTKSWGSIEIEKRIADKGQLMWTDDVISYMENDETGYVSVPGEEEGFTVEEFASRFVMN